MSAGELYTEPRFHTVYVGFCCSSPLHVDEEEDEKYWAHLVNQDIEEDAGDDAEDPLLWALDDALVPSGSASRVLEPKRAVVRRTRRGRIRREVKEIYEQEDYPCGLKTCSVCTQTQVTGLERLSNTMPVLILDAPILMSNADLLWDDPAVNNCVLLESGIREVALKNRRSYTKLLRLAGHDIPSTRTTRRRKKEGLDAQQEVPEDRKFVCYPDNVSSGCRSYLRNLPADVPPAVTAYAWYFTHLAPELPPSCPVELITDTDSRRREILSALNAVLHTDLSKSVMTLRAFVERARVEQGIEGTGEKLAAVEDDEAMDDVEASNPLVAAALASSGLEVCSEASHRRSVYSAHWPSTTVGRAVRQGKAFMGTIRTNMNSCFKGTVIVRRGNDVSIEIRVAGAMNMNRAVDGDQVVVRLLAESDTQALKAAAIEESAIESAETTTIPDDQSTTASSDSGSINLSILKTGGNLWGQVVAVTRRNWRTYCGSFRKLESGQRPPEERVFVPANPRIPNILVKTAQGSTLEGRRLVVAIDSWDRFSLYPRGHWIEDFGPANDVDTECKVILREHDVITRPFSQAVLQCLPPEDYAIPADEVKKRLDIRPRFCFCEVCHARRRNEKVRGEDNSDLKNLVGTPAIYTRDDKRPLPLIKWDERAPKDKEFNKVTKERKSNPQWEEYMYEGGDKTMHANATLCCSIDPPTCVDIDDSLSVRYLPNGNYEIGVHIADVTHYVRPETAIDKEAADRCTTVYLVNQRTDMLPSLLSADLCSLKSGVDRLSFSVFWEITKNAEIKHTRFHKTVMHSVAALNYQQAQNMIDDSSDKSPMAVRLRVLNETAKKLRQQRMDRGAVELASDEVKFTFKRDEKDPSAVSAYEHYDTHHLVEEFMLLANVSVAERIVRSFPDCAVLRRHPPPKTEGLESLRKLLQKKGFTDFEFDTSKDLADSLNKCHDPQDPSFNALLRCITVQFMNQAVYMCTGDVRDETARRHYALASNLYTHFTSPIRRYADVLVHRQLAAALSLESLPLSMSQTIQMTEQCERMTERHRNAQFCQRASQAYFAYRLFSRAAKATTVHAIITGIRATGCFVRVPEHGLECTALVDTQEWKFDPEDMTLTHGVQGTLAIFDHVIVKVEAFDEDYRYKVMYEIQRKATAKEVQNFSSKGAMSASDADA